MLRSLAHEGTPLVTLPQGMRLAVLGERADIEIARERLTRRHSLAEGGGGARVSWRASGALGQASFLLDTAHPRTLNR
jgi:hypothetical protein